VNNEEGEIMQYRWVKHQIARPLLATRYLSEV